MIFNQEYKICIGIPIGKNWKRTMGWLVWFIACFWISSRPLIFVPQIKIAKTRNFYLIARLQSDPYLIKKKLDYVFYFSSSITEAQKQKAEEARKKRPAKGKGKTPDIK